MAESQKARRQVTVGLFDLKLLVWICFDQKVNTYAQTMVLNQPGHNDPEAASEFARLVDKAVPEAKGRVQLRFRSLLESLESGKDVGTALASFVHGVDTASMIRPD